MTLFRFESPLFFLLLIPLAFLVWLEYRRRPASVVFSDVSLLKTLPRTFAQRVSPLVPWLLFVGIGLLIVALARPQTGKEEYRIRAEGIALMMCVDRSGSMAAEDFVVDGHRVDRLEAVKKTFRDFVAGNDHLPGRKDDMIGLLGFGGYVDAYCPLTLDHATLLEMADQIQLPLQIDGRRQRIPQEIAQFFSEEGMTAIGDALAVAVERLKDVQAKSKVIVLLSDGAQTFGTLTPQEGAEAAKAFGITIYTIGIGGNVEINSGLMRQLVVIDEDSLREVAKMTGGQYFNAKNTQALEQVYAEIDKLEKTEHEGRLYTQYRELYRVPLLVGTLLVVLNLILVNTRFRRLP